MKFSQLTGYLNEKKERDVGCSGPRNEASLE